MAYNLTMNNDIYEFISDVYEEEINNLYDIETDIVEINELVINNFEQLGYFNIEFTGAHYFDDNNCLHMELAKPYFKYFIIDRYGINSEEIEQFINSVNCWQIEV